MAGHCRVQGLVDEFETEKWIAAVLGDLSTEREDARRSGRGRNLGQAQNAGVQRRVGAHAIAGLLLELCSEQSRFQGIVLGVAAGNRLQQQPLHLQQGRFDDGEVAEGQRALGPVKRTPRDRVGVLLAGESRILGICQLAERVGACSLPHDRREVGVVQVHRPLGLKSARGRRFDVRGVDPRARQIQLGELKVIVGDVQEDECAIEPEVEAVHQAHCLDVQIQGPADFAELNVNRGLLADGDDLDERGPFGPSAFSRAIEDDERSTRLLRFDQMLRHVDPGPQRPVLPRRLLVELDAVSLGVQRRVKLPLRGEGLTQHLPETRLEEGAAQAARGGDRIEKFARAAGGVSPHGA